MLQETGNSDCKPLPSLVICPPTLTGHWVYEVEKFVSKEYLKPLHYTGPPSERQRLVSGVCLLKYFSTLRSVLYAVQFLSRCCFSFIILILKNCYLQNISFWKLLQAVQKLSAISKIILSPKMVSCLNLKLESYWEHVEIAGVERRQRSFTAKVIFLSYKMTRPRKMFVIYCSKSC